MSYLVEHMSKYLTLRLEVEKQKLLPGKVGFLGFDLWKYVILYKVHVDHRLDYLPSQLHGDRDDKNPASRFCRNASRVCHVNHAPQESVGR